MEIAPEYRHYWTKEKGSYQSLGWCSRVYILLVMVLRANLESWEQRAITADPANQRTLWSRGRNFWWRLESTWWRKLVCRSPYIIITKSGLNKQWGHCMPTAINLHSPSVSVHRVVHNMQYLVLVLDSGNLYNTFILILIIAVRIGQGQELCQACMWVGQNMKAAS